MPATDAFYVAEDDPPAKVEILHAALELFSGRGVANTTIRDIAAASGYTNPALYKHFESKDALALYLFERCHQSVWARCRVAATGAPTFDERLNDYVTQWLSLIDQEGTVVAFLADSARELWPLSNATVRRQTFVSLATTLLRDAPRFAGRAHQRALDIAAAGLQGTLSEFSRMLHVGAISGPAVRWKALLLDQIHRTVS